MSKSFFGTSDTRLNSKGDPAGSVSGKITGTGKDSRPGSGVQKTPALGQGSKKDLGASGSIESSSMGSKKGSK